MNTKKLTQFEIKEPPQDTITSLKFGKDPNNLIATSWDKVK
jgi:hypothetical protein